MHILRSLLIRLGISAVVVVFILMALPMVIRLDRTTETFVSHLNQTLPVKILIGRNRLRLLPHIALSLEEIVIRDATEPVIEAPSAEVRFLLSSLLTNEKVANLHADFISFHPPTIQSSFWKTPEALRELLNPELAKPKPIQIPSNVKIPTYLNTPVPIQTEAPSFFERIQIQELTISNLKIANEMISEVRIEFAKKSPTSSTWALFGTLASTNPIASALASCSSEPSIQGSIPFKAHIENSKVIFDAIEVGKTSWQGSLSFDGELMFSHESFRVSGALRKPLCEAPKKS